MQKKLFDPRYPFRKRGVKNASQKRISKVKNRTISSFHVLRVFFTVPFCYRSAWNVFSFIPVVIHKFFFLQYWQKLHITHYPIKNVDNLLDYKVPFVPEEVSTYMKFINFWIRPMSMLMHRFGYHSGSALSGEYLSYIKLAYNEAYKMYTTSLTTTRRPESDNKGIKSIQAADPHYLCVPSLHISIACLTYSFYKMLFERENFTQEEKEKWEKEFLNDALDICESVLYVKQHSVNCIPAAMYMLTKIMPELFSAEDAVFFIDNLFKNAPDVSAQDAQEIHEYIIFMFERFLLEGTYSEEWHNPIARWLETYSPYLPENKKYTVIHRKARNRNEELKH